jgi:hypothetical protein
VAKAMRLYSPRSAILERTWTPPPAQEAAGGRACRALQ